MRFLDIVDSLPRTVCHRGYNAGNLFVQRDKNMGEQTSVIDWDCTSIGGIGEDIADMIGEALIFYDFDLGEAEDLKESVLAHYYRRIIRNYRRIIRRKRGGKVINNCLG